jgi:hypothetical protein
MTRTFGKILLALVLVAAGCGGGSDEGGDTTSVPAVSTTTPGSDTTVSATTEVEANETTTNTGSGAAETTTTDTVGEGTTTTSIPDEVVPFTGDVGCAIANSWAGESAEDGLVRLGPCKTPVVGDNLTDFSSGGVVTTDANGEAQILLENDCGRIHVFRNSQLRLSNCDEGAQESGAACLLDGTASWLNEGCPGVSIQTPSARITVSGTYLTVAYLPGPKVTLIDVIEGEALATKVDEDGFELSPTVVVSSQHLWYSSLTEFRFPDAVEAQPIGISQLPGIVAVAALEPVFAAVNRRAITDGIQPELLPPIEAVNVRVGGGRLNDVDTQTDFLTAIRWDFTTVERPPLFASFADVPTTLVADPILQPNLNEFALPESQFQPLELDQFTLNQFAIDKYIELGDVQYNLALASNASGRLISRLGSRTILVLVPVNDAGLRQVADELIGSLAETGVGAEIRLVSDGDEALNRFGVVLDQDQDQEVISITRW